jgi:hypothetical protein
MAKQVEPYGELLLKDADAIFEEYFGTDDSLGYHTRRAHEVFVRAPQDQWATLVAVYEVAADRGRIGLVVDALAQHFAGQAEGSPIDTSDFLNGVCVNILGYQQSVEAPRYPLPAADEQTSDFGRAVVRAVRDISG